MKYSTGCEEVMQFNDNRTKHDKIRYNNNIVFHFAFLLAQSILINFLKKQPNSITFPCLFWRQNQHISCYFFIALSLRKFSISNLIIIIIIMISFHRNFLKIRKKVDITSSVIGFLFFSAFYKNSRR